ncbi:MAG: AhpC/TSA family protein [Hyphomonadaceae bacterium]|nr:AhpC/TSA family protein [Hyphomonadaceae bacterium]
MTLQAKLDAFKASWTERVGPAVARTMSDANDALLPLATKALKAGDRFPSVKLADHLARETDISTVAAAQPVVVAFYRGGWCPYCSLELRAYQKALPEIEQLGARLIAVSPEAPDNTLSTAEKDDLSFTVLSDARGRLAEALGIRFELTEPVKAYFIKAGHDLPAHNGDGRWSLPMPATYVIAQGGVIALAHVDPDYRKRLEPKAVIEALAALRQPQAV